MKHFFTTFACLIFINAGFAQTPAVEWGPELVKPRKTEITGLIGRDKNSFYCLRSVFSLFGSKNDMIEKYSAKTLKLEYVREIRLPEINGRQLKKEGVYIVNGKILIFSSAYFSDQDKKIAYVQRIDAEDGSLMGQPKEIDYIVAEKKRNSGSFDFTLSDDSTKILVANNPPYDKYSNEKFSYKLIDSEGKILWSTSLELPYKDKYFQVSNYKVDNLGNVYMLASVTKEKADRERKKPDYTYNIVKYNPESKSLKEIPISLGDMYISDIAFTSTSKGTLVLGGFYSNKGSDGVAGTFCMTIDKATSKIVSSGTKDFTTEFLAEFMSERRAEKKKELYSYRINEIVAQTNGGVIIVAEQFYISQVTTCDSRGNCRTTYYYNYKDIIVASFNSDASLKWVKHIPKYQSSANDGGFLSSYSLVVTKDKLHFIYNDHPKNLEPDRDPKKYRNGISKKMITVDVAMNISNGQFEKVPLFSAKEEKMYTRPKIAIQLSENKSLFYALKRKKFKFGVIKF